MTELDRQTPYGSQLGVAANIAFAVFVSMKRLNRTDKKQKERRAMQHDLGQLEVCPNSDS